MALTFDQLTAPRTAEELRDLLFQALQGIGFVRHSGTGTGAVLAAGVAEGTHDVVVRVATEGEPGAAEFEYSLDGGRTWSSPITVPSGGAYVLGSTGATLTFLPGPPRAGSSFVKGDTYRFAMATPALGATAWQEGSTPRTLIENDAAVLEDLDDLIAKIARGGLLYTAEGAWLDLLARELYGVERRPAVQARGIVRLTDAAGAGPFVIAPGQLWATTASGLRFNNVNGGTLVQGDTLDLVFGAESPGSTYNVLNNTITTLLTPLPGVTINNPDPEWKVQSGVDRETDAALRTRCVARWAQLGIGATEDAYEGWARDASADVNRVLVRASPTIPGQVEMFLAGPDGAVAADVVEMVEAYIKPRVPLTATTRIESVTSVVIPIDATVTVQAAYRSTAERAVLANLHRYQNEVPIGGTVYHAQIIEELMTPAGVIDAEVVLGGPGTLPPMGAAVFSVNLTWVEV